MLAERAFRNLWLGHSISLLGAQAGFVIVPLLALTVADASAFEMGLLEAAESLAVLLLGLVVGAFADRASAVTVMITANVTRITAMVTIPIAYVLGDVTFLHIFAVIFVVGACTLGYESALSSHIVHRFERHRLPTVNSFMEGSTAVTEISGPGVGGLLVQFFGAPLAIVVDICGYVTSTIFLIRLPRGDDRLSSKDVNGPTDRVSIARGLGFVWRNGVLRPVTLAASHFNFFTAMFFAVYTYYLVRDLGFSPFMVGVSAAAGGLGGLVSATLAPRMMTRIQAIALYPGALIVPALAALLVPLAGTVGPPRPIVYVLVGLSQFLWAFAVVVNLVVSEALKQILTPPSVIGQTTSSIRWMTLGLEPIGAVIGGILAEVLSPALALVSSGLGLVTSVVWLLDGRELREFNLPEALARDEDQDEPTIGT